MPLSFFRKAKIKPALLGAGFFFFALETQAACVIRVQPSFPLRFVPPLVAKNYTVVTDPEVKQESFENFLKHYVKEGESAILVGGLIQGGFELWRKGEEKPVYSAWSWTESSEKVIQRVLPRCELPR